MSNTNLNQQNNINPVIFLNLLTLINIDKNVV